MKRCCVRVDKCGHPSFWYNGQVGNEFVVKGEYTVIYTIVEGDWSGKGIFFDDCSVLGEWEEFKPIKIIKKRGGRNKLHM